LSDPLYIKASCVITRETVYTNDVAVYSLQGASLTDFLQDAYQFFGCNYPKFHKMDNLGKLGFLASELILRPYEIERYAPADRGIVLANANASLDTDLKYYETVNAIASPALFVYTLPNIVIGEISIRNQFKGENAFFVFNGFDATFMHGYVTSLFANNLLQVCVCGWIEVLDDQYKAVLLLIEKEKPHTEELFTPENFNKIYQL
jgi:hypothetical protein